MTPDFRSNDTLFNALVLILRSKQRWGHLISVGIWANRCDIGLQSYPLTAPTVKPAMNRSTKKLYRMAIGTLAIKQAAISEPQK
jgi:hypothetical protein